MSGLLKDSLQQDPRCDRILDDEDPPPRLSRGCGSGCRPIRLQRILDQFERVENERHAAVSEDNGPLDPPDGAELAPERPDDDLLHPDHLVDRAGDLPRPVGDDDEGGWPRVRGRGAGRRDAQDVGEPDDLDRLPGEPDRRPAPRGSQGVGVHPEDLFHLLYREDIDLPPGTDEQAAEGGHPHRDGEADGSPPADGRGYRHTPPEAGYGIFDDCKSKAPPREVGDDPARRHPRPEDEPDRLAVREGRILFLRDHPVLDGGLPDRVAVDAGPVVDHLDADPAAGAGEDPDPHGTGGRFVLSYPDRRLLDTVIDAVADQVHDGFSQCVEDTPVHFDLPSLDRELDGLSRCAGSLPHERGERREHACRRKQRGIVDQV
ncbi:hypothetical protein DSECCO2_517360 [anaerobic digester metagenome]